jgi:hypothetical protein
MEVCEMRPPGLKPALNCGGFTRRWKRRSSTVRYTFIQTRELQDQSQRRRTGVFDPQGLWWPYAALEAPLFHGAVYVYPDRKPQDQGQRRRTGVSDPHGLCGGMGNPMGMIFRISI